MRRVLLASRRLKAAARPARTVLTLLALTGCAQVDPYTRQGMWQPNGANSLNLAAMAANPTDLLHGHGDSGPQSALAAAAAYRLLAGTPKPLPLITDDIPPGGASGAVPAAPAAAAN